MSQFNEGDILEFKKSIRAAIINGKFCVSVRIAGWNVQNADIR